MSTINDTIARVLRFEPPIVDGRPAIEPGRFGYIAPFLNQARQVAWDYTKRYTQGMLKKAPSEAELSVTFFNDAKFTLYGADNPDAFRGLYFDGVDLDEYGMMRPSTWSEVILPTLVDRRGWATFIGTPNGPNHFRKLVQEARKDPERWFLEIWPVSKTGLIPEEELAEMRKLMLPEEYEQEMECSFEASTRGAFYSAEMSLAEKEQRCRPLNANTDFPLHFIYDLGYTDDTATLCWQDAVDGYPIIHAESESMRPIAHYIKRIPEIASHYGCTVGDVWLPHDARAKSLQTGRSIVEQFLSAGIRPRIVPRLDILDGIAAARLLFPDVYFNADPNRSAGPCWELIEALKTYHREWDEKVQAFKANAAHDWSSHYADVFRYFSLVARKVKEKIADDAETKSVIHTYPFTLNDLWRDRDGQVARNKGWIR